MTSDADSGFEAHCVVAIDGPAGSGKSTVARAVAERIGFAYLDTGAMYRAVTFAALRAGVDSSDPVALGALAERLDIRVDEAGVAVDGVDVTDAIRSSEVTEAVSSVSKVSAVRDHLRSLQRAWLAERGGGVLEGRDIGTVVVPDARLKVFLSASPEVRAKRRAAERGDADWQSIAAEIERRDAQDSGRADSPLRPADDAVRIDSSAKSISDVVEEIVSALGARTS